VAIQPGSELAGYRIEAILGSGGMGTVYRAVDIRLGRQVALKFLAAPIADNPHARERFVAESRLAASLDHPHIVPIYEAGEVDGALFIAMRYVEGTDLASILDGEGPLKPDRAVRLLAGIADALDAAHDRGLVHRDVKPGNILIGRTARGEHPYLADFGLGKHQGSGGITATGQILGSVDYIAPEQIEGRATDHRADVYSLACVLYACLVGQPPYPRDSDIAALWAHVQAPTPRPSDTKPDLARFDPVVARGMAKSAEDRYATAGELIRDAAHVMDTSGAGGAKGFLFADLRGYTAYVERRGNQAAVALLGRYRALVRAEVARHHGAEIKTEGDSFYVVFPSARTAVECALGIRAAAGATGNNDPAAVIRVGIGVHAGETVATEEGFVGSAVNIAARVAAQAEAGEVLVTDTVRGLVRGNLDAKFEPRGRRHLKGIEGAVPVFAAHAASGELPRGRERRLGRPVAAVVAALVLFAVVAGVARLLSNGTFSAPPAPGSSDRVVAPPASIGIASGTTGGPEARLRALLPPRINSRCVPATTSDGALNGIASLRCELVAEGADTAWFDLFDGSGAVTSRSDAISAAARVAEGVCDGTHTDASTDWRYGSTYGGRMICYHDGEAAWLVWTYAARDLIGQAMRRDGDSSALYAWWKEVGPFVR
jgi:class 3 adenylate cyclase